MQTREDVATAAAAQWADARPRQFFPQALPFPHDRDRSATGNQAAFLHLILCTRKRLVIV